MAKGGEGDGPLGSPEVTCAAVPVDVEGKQAVWIFTEFETERVAQDPARLADPGPLARVGRRHV